MYFGTRSPPTHSGKDRGNGGKSQGMNGRIRGAIALFQFAELQIQLGCHGMDFADAPRVERRPETDDGQKQRFSDGYLGGL
jgi:hypothetical protein